MIRTLLATTAIAALLTAGAFAQDTTATPADPNAPATEAPVAEATAVAPTSILASGYTTTDKDLSLIHI